MDSQHLNERPMNERANDVPIERLPSLLRLAIESLLGFLVFAFPIFFGGVHPAVYLPVLVAVLAITAALLLAVPQRVALSLSPFPQRAAIAVLGLVLLALLFQFLLFGSRSLAHPLVSTAALNREHFSSAIAMVLLFAGTLFITSVYMAGDRRKEKRIFNGIALSALPLCLIALMHWFYDNGRLFWLFEPDYVFISPRARWPFVNSNHLADYLLPLFFLVAAHLGVSRQRLSSETRSKHTGRIRSGKELVLRASSQRALIAVAYDLVALAIVLLVLIATQSRSSWIGLTAGIATLLLIRGPASQRAEEKSPVQGERTHRGGRRRRRPLWRKFFNACIARGRAHFFTTASLLFMALLIGFFLSGGGKELFEDRLEFGLSHSKDDIRWELYRESLPLFWEHPLVGVGMGNWLDSYRQKTPPALAGLDPEYLHSDPLQFLLEMGVLGAAPLFLFAGLLIARALRHSRRLPP